MRAEDKQIDGPELLLEERKDRVELVEEEYDQLPLAGEERRDTFGERGQLLTAMRAILEGRELQLSELRLPQREMAALETLQAAKNGRDSELDKFLYAEDREEMLEQALAILQANLAGQAARDVEDMRGAFNDVITKVADLRRELHHLADAEEEIVVREVAVTKGEGDTDDDKDDDDDADDGDQSLTGPERKQPPKPPSSLLGPDVGQAPKPASSLTGPLPTFEVRLVAATGKDPIDALRELRDLTGIGLREAKLLLDEPGGTLMRVTDVREAATLKKQLEAAGYTIEIREKPGEPQ